MGLFSFFKKKEVVEDKEFRWMTVDEALERSEGKTSVETSEMLHQVMEDDCALILEINQHLQEAKLEYEVVTSNLVDVQKLDAIPLEDRGSIEETARSILNLGKERQKYQSIERGIRLEQFHRFEQYEDEIPMEMRRMQEHETYQQMVMNDIRQLEGEKGAIRFECEEIRRKRSFMKKLSVWGCILIVSLFLFLFLLSNYTRSDMMIPFFMSALIGMIIVAYVVLGRRQCNVTQKKAEAKLNRAITLMNKVKIKYVNCTSALDYTYDKFGVNGYRELAYLWEKYVKAKDEDERYKKNTELLEYYNRDIIKELRSYGIKSPEIWVHQPLALLDPKEMVEVRHHLNDQRNKLREQIEMYSKQKDISLNQIQSLLMKHKGHREMILGVLDLYGIEL